MLGFARYSGTGKYVESHNLTSCLPKFLLVLKDRECPESAITKLVIKWLKKYESSVSITDFCGAIGGCSREAMVLKQSA
jgi:hypothetical protein